ncbi:hypothetical protein [Streptomyces broussonetiae]|uniref:Uncharacterized protein n=1 Tax=Streptomyces broussonetiae TaxID=2686304 RepID=A0A6I6MSV0_9ACTN|nr:hypothetical protein [Streptomyces broussonetiae]QHA03423.1 hypothetical protein GQF42_09220 [Streptomyces broussonetiae]
MLSHGRPEGLSRALGRAAVAHAAWCGVRRMITWAGQGPGGPGCGSRRPVGRRRSGTAPVGPALPFGPGERQVAAVADRIERRAIGWSA